MKRFSLLAIAAIAALALTAAIGSATASAGVLCKSLKTTCPSSEVLPAGTSLVYGTNVANLKQTDVWFSGTSGFEFGCKWGVFGEKTTEERGPLYILSATGGRALSECASTIYSSCTMSMSNSSDVLYAESGGAASLESGSVTATANCSGSGGYLTCEWTGHANASYHQGAVGAEEEPYELVFGRFTYVSGTSNGGSTEAQCGGKEVVLKTVPLYYGGKPGTWAFVTN